MKNTKTLIVIIAIGILMMAMFIGDAEVNKVMRNNLLASLGIITSLIIIKSNQKTNSDEKRTRI